MQRQAQNLMALAGELTNPHQARRIRFRAWLAETGRDKQEIDVTNRDFLVWEIAALAGMRSASR